MPGPGLETRSDAMSASPAARAPIETNPDSGKSQGQHVRPRDMAAPALAGRASGTHRAPTGRAGREAGDRGHLLSSTNASGGGKARWRGQGPVLRAAARQRAPRARPFTRRCGAVWPLRPAPAGRTGSWHLIEASTTAIAASTLQGARTESPECTPPAARAAKAQAEPGQGAELAAGGGD